MAVLLEPIKHIYYDEDEPSKTYVSISKLLSLYKPKFDPTGQILIASARKQSKLRGVEITPEMLQAEWNRGNKDSTTRGTFIHAICEDYIKKGLTPSASNVARLIPKLESFNDPLILKGFIPVSEQIFHNDEFGLAGTSDLPWYNHKTMNCFVSDFKTDKVVNYTSDYGNFYLDPISHLEQCEWTDHALQLSFYAYFMELKGYKPKNSWVLHIVVDKTYLEITKENQQELFERDGILYNIGEKIVESWFVSDVKKIPCPYLKLEVLLILNDFKKRFKK
jgi:hypothetical protein